jgi:hypothetical protein
MSPSTRVFVRKLDITRPKGSYPKHYPDCLQGRDRHYPPYPLSKVIGPPERQGKLALSGIVGFGQYQYFNYPEP